MKKRKTNNGKRVDSTCRNHGSCDWCKGNRLHHSDKGIMVSNEQLKEYYYANRN